MGKSNPLDIPKDSFVTCVNKMYDAKNPWIVQCFENAVRKPSV